MSKTGKILLTGATGFIGGSTAALLFRHGADVTYIVRGTDQEDAHRRLLTNVRKFDPQFYVGRNSVICTSIGDLSNHISKLQEITTVINLAAVASFGEQPTVWDVNLTQTHKFLSALRYLRNVKRIIHTSTAFTCGINQQSKVIKEDVNIFDHSIVHQVPYGDSKLQVERLIKTVFADLPIIVVRPSIVIGDTADGCNGSDCLFWLFRILKELQVFTFTPEQSLDIVSADYVSSVLIALAGKEHLAHSVYNITAGSTASTYQQLIDLYCPEIDYRTVSINELKGAAKALPMEKYQIRIAQKALEQYGLFAKLGYVFDNANTLSELPYLKPVPFANYINRCAVTSAEKTIWQQMQTDFRS